MAVPVRRPHFLLPWIAFCTLVLGVGLHLLAPERTRRGEAGNQVEILKPGSPWTAPLPARLLPEGGNWMVQDGLKGMDGALRTLEQDGALPAGFRPGDEPASFDGLTATLLAAQGEANTRRESERSVEQVSPRPLNGTPKRPALLHSRSAASASAMDALMPEAGNSWHLSWDSEFAALDAADDGQEDLLPLRPEIVIVRLDEDAFRAYLVLDDSGSDGSGEENGSGEVTDPGKDPEPEASGEDPQRENTKRQRWARWFAAQVPPGSTVQRPTSRAELYETMKRALGERKTAYLAASTRDLNAQETAQLLGQVRRWVLEQRAG